MDLPPDKASDDAYRRYINVERERVGKDKLDAPLGPGLPALLDQEKRAWEAERKAAERHLQLAKETEAKIAKDAASKEAAERKTLTREHKAREKAKMWAFSTLEKSYEPMAMRVRLAILRKEAHNIAQTPADRVRTEPVKPELVPAVLREVYMRKHPEVAGTI